MLKRYNCQCGNPVFFRNSTCLVCATPLGYDPVIGLVIPLAAGAVEGNWQRFNTDGNPPLDPLLPASAPGSLAQYRRCANLQTPAACNWLIDAAEPPANIYCRACRLNRTIPDLSDPTHPDNGVHWGRVELAKRRMLAGLSGLGLPVV